jgi:hypothetical protein
MAVNGGSILIKIVYILMSGILHLWEQSSKKLSSYEEHVLVSYRKLQVFEKLLNSCVKAYIFPISSVIGPILQILTGFTLIHTHNTLGVSELLFFGVIFIDTGVVINILFFTGAKQSFSQSEEWLSKMKRIHGKDKKNRRILRSMMPLRVWFGSNWVDRTTPLVIQQFCWVHIANLLLLV